MIWGEAVLAAAEAATRVLTLAPLLDVAAVWNHRLSPLHRRCHHRLHYNNTDTSTTTSKAIEAVAVAAAV